MEKKKNIIIISIVAFLLTFLIIQSNKKYTKKIVKKKVEKTDYPRFDIPKKIVKKYSYIVKKGDTIAKILQNFDFDNNYVHKFIEKIKDKYDLKNLRVGAELSLNIKKNKITFFKYQIKRDKFLQAFLNKDKKSYDIEIKTMPYTIKNAVVTGVIENSLFGAILKSGEKPYLADKMAKLYDYDIDFNRDLRKGDSFSLFVEKLYLKGKFRDYGNIQAAIFVNKGKEIKIFRYKDPSNVVSLYHANGKAVKKMFLKCPLPFMRITSRYGMRHHPLLKFSRRHNGIDLGAPRGTKVRSTASGTIVAMGRSRGKGKYIIVRHRNKYRTHYYHLSGFRRGIKKGARVSQGELIAYVGSTGLSTGPHLHYGVEKNRKYINPLSLKSPSIKPLNKEYLEDFNRYRMAMTLLLKPGLALNRGYSWEFPFKKEVFLED